MIGTVQVPPLSRLEFSNHKASLLMGVIQNLENAGPSIHWTRSERTTINILIHPNSCPQLCDFSSIWTTHPMPWAYFLFYFSFNDLHLYSPSHLLLPKPHPGLESPGIILPLKSENSRYFFNLNLNSFILTPGTPSPWPCWALQSPRASTGLQGSFWPSFTYSFNFSIPCWTHSESKSWINSTISSVPTRRLQSAAGEMIQLLKLVALAHSKFPKPPDC